MKDHLRMPSLPRHTVPLCFGVHAGTLRAAADVPGRVAPRPASHAGDVLRFAF